MANAGHVVDGLKDSIEVLEKSPTEQFTEISTWQSDLHAALEARFHDLCASNGPKEEEYQARLRAKELSILQLTDSVERLKEQLASMLPS